MPRWLPVDPNTINVPSTRKIHGVDVEAWAAPQDVPEAVRVFADPESKHVFVEFRYMTGEEPLIVAAERDGVQLFIGQFSRRLFRIVIHADKSTVADFMGTVTSMIEELNKSRATPPRSENYRTTEQVLAVKGRDLFAELAETSR
jgi:hypothetical protein